MKISRIVDLHADAGWRLFCVPENRDGRGSHRLVGVHESNGSKGLSVVIMKLAEMLICQDPARYREPISRSIRRRAAQEYAST